MSQDIVFWSLSLKVKKAENVRGTEEQTVVHLFFWWWFFGQHISRSGIAFGNGIWTKDWSDEKDYLPKQILGQIILGKE